MKKTHAVQSGEIRSEFRDDPEMAELISWFVQEMPERVNAIAESWRDQRIEELQRLAHQLKGACGGYGFQAVSDAAHRLEESLQVEQDLERAREDVERLVDMCRRVTV